MYLLFLWNCDNIMSHGHVSQGVNTLQDRNLTFDKGGLSERIDNRFSFSTKSEMLL